MQQASNLLAATWGSMACYSYGVGFSILLLLLLWCLYQWFRPSSTIRVSPQTTFLTVPLLANGMPDYRDARLKRRGQGLSPEKNAAIPFWRGVGREEWPPEEWTLLEKELGAGLDDSEASFVGFSDGLQFVLEDWCGSQFGGALDWDWMLQSELESVLQSMPWGSKEFPEVAEFIAQHDAAYQQLEKAASLKQFYSPIQIDLVRSDELPVDMSFSMVFIAAIKRLGMRANLRLGDGDVDAAWRDLEVGYRLVELYPLDSWLDLLIVVSAEGMLMRQAQGLLAHPELTPAVLAGMEQSLQRMTPPLERLRQCQKGERLFGLEAIVKTSADPAKQREELEGSKSRWLLAGSVDWNAILERQNQMFDELDAALELPDWGQRAKAFRGYEKRLSKNNLDGGIWSGRFLMSFVSGGVRASYIADELQAKLTLPSSLFEVVIRVELERQLYAIALKVAAYRVSERKLPSDLIEAGVYPANLADLVYGQPVVYRKVSDNVFTLNVFGENRQDDGGAHHMFTQIYGRSPSELSSSLWRLLAPAGGGMEERSILPEADDFGVAIFWPDEKAIDRVHRIVRLRQGGMG